MLDMRPLLIFGASRGVGLELARLERQAHRHVYAPVRLTSKTTALQEIGAAVLRGDALSKEDLSQILAKVSGDIDIISTLGGQADDGRRADDEGNINVIDAAVASDRVRRFLLVTSIGCGEMAPFRSSRAIAAFGATVDAKSRAEERLKSSGLNWTILRPGGLISEPATGKALLSQDAEIHGFIHREDVAQLAFRALRDPATIGRAFAAVDAQQMSSVNTLPPFPLAFPSLFSQA